MKCTWTTRSRASGLHSGVTLLRERECPGQRSQTPVHTNSVQPEAAQRPVDTLSRCQSATVRDGEMLCVLHAGRPSKPSVACMPAPFPGRAAQFLPPGPRTLPPCIRVSTRCLLWRRTPNSPTRPGRSFTLMMQTGAFLQLVLALAAIASRLSLVLSEVRSALEVSWAASYRALQTLFVSLCLRNHHVMLAHSMSACRSHKGKETRRYKLYSRIPASPSTLNLHIHALRRCP